MMASFMLKMAFLNNPILVYQSSSNPVTSLVACAPLHHFDFIP